MSIFYKKITVSLVQLIVFIMVIIISTYLVARSITEHHYDSTIKEIQDKIDEINGEFYEKEIVHFI